MLLGGSALALDSQPAGHTRLRCGTVCVHTLEHTQTCALSSAQTRIQMDAHAHLQPLVYAHTQAWVTAELRAQGCPPSPSSPHTPGAPHRRALGAHQRCTDLIWHTHGPTRRHTCSYPQGQSLPCEESPNPIAGDRNYCSDTESSLAGPRWTLGEGEKMRSALRGGRQEPRADKDKRQT